MPILQIIAFRFDLFAACENQVLSESGSDSSYSNPLTAVLPRRHNTSAADRVHDVLSHEPLASPSSTEQTTPSQVSPVSPISPSSHYTPSPPSSPFFGHYLTFSSSDLPLCPGKSRTTFCGEKFETKKSSDQHRFEFIQSSAIKSRSIKRSVSLVDEPLPKDPVPVSNVFPEKRQSDPQIRYAFCNQGFEAATWSRRFSLNQFEMRRKAMPHIDEYSFEEDLDQYQMKEWPVDSLSAAANVDGDTIVPLPRLKIRVWDNDGQRMDESCDSSSDDFAGAYFNVAEDWFQENYGYMRNELVDPFQGNHCHENGTKCTKCGHKCLMKQFTNSFA